MLIPYDDLDLYEINIDVNSTNIGYDHLTLVVEAPGYKSWLDRYWEKNAGDMVAWTLPDVPDEVLEAATHMGLILELTSERLGRELVRTAKEHDTERTEGRCECDPENLSAMEPFYHADPLGECRYAQSETKQISQQRRVGRLSDKEAEARLAELPRDEKYKELLQAGMSSLKLARTYQLIASVPSGHLRLWEWRVRNWLAESDKEISG